MCFAIKPGLNGMLDVSRRTYTEIIEDIQILVRNLSLEYSLPLKVAFNSTRGFFIQMYDPVARRTNSDRQLPELFKKITKINGNYSFTTDELIRLNGRLNETLSEIFSLSSKVLEDLVLQISQFLTCVYKLIDSVSIVDMLYSLATYRTTLEESCKPEFTDTLVLTHCHHPLIEKNRISVPNNVYCSPTQNINIITGRNMSGKSTYLKMISWIQIMSHLGCFLPCKYASVSPRSSIFTRLTHNDSIEKNLSTFQIEVADFLNRQIFWNISAFDQI
ncbi:MAG: MutS protein msh4, variant 2 [Marteilia pararefringens]